MQKLYFVSLFAIMAACLTSAQAETPQVTVALAPAGVTVSPAEGQVAALQSFEVTYVNATSVKWNITGYGNAPYINTTGAGTDGKQKWCFDYSESGNKLICSCSSPITDDGKWSLTLPATGHIVDGVESTETIEFNYTIGDVTPDPVDFTATVSPAEGQVAALQKFDITFVKASTVEVHNINYGNAPTLHKTGSDAGRQFCFDYSTEGNVMHLGVSDVVAEEGDWTLTLPGGFYKVDGVESTETIEFNYTIGAATPDPVDYQITVSPAEGQVAALQSFEVTYVNATSVKWNITGYGNAPYINTTGAGTDGKQKWCFDYSESGNKLICSCSSPITDDGKWSLTLPATGHIVDGVETTADLNFNYTIGAETPDDPAAITEIDGEETGNAVYFNLLGEPIAEPQGGVYIKVTTTGGAKKATKVVY